MWNHSHSKKNIIVFQPQPTATSPLAGNNHLEMQPNFEAPERYLQWCNPKCQVSSVDSEMDCGNFTARSKPWGNVKDSKLEQNGSNLNNSKPTNHLSKNPLTIISQVLVFHQILRFWIWFLAKNTPHFTPFHIPFCAHPAVKRFVATGALVGGLTDVHVRKPTMIS